MRSMLLSIMFCLISSVSCGETVTEADLTESPLDNLVYKKFSTTPFTGSVKATKGFLFQGSYKRGLKDGEWVEFDNNGTLIGKDIFKNGILLNKSEALCVEIIEARIEKQERINKIYDIFIKHKILELRKDSPPFKYCDDEKRCKERLHARISATGMFLPYTAPPPPTRSYGSNRMQSFFEKIDSIPVPEPYESRRAKERYEELGFVASFPASGEILIFCDIDKDDVAHFSLLQDSKPLGLPRIISWDDFYNLEKNVR